MDSLSPPECAAAFDIIGDVHGCAHELVALFAELGYEIANHGQPVSVTPPTGRCAVFLGDLVDRGPRSPEVLRIAKHMVDNGRALAVIGNHDDKLRRYLHGRDVQVNHGLDATIDQLESEPLEFLSEVRDWLDSLASHYVLDDGKLVVAHAGIREEMQGLSSASIRRFCMFGETSGEMDEFGLPVRWDWVAGYRGRAKVVYGHTPVWQSAWRNNTICIDNGCVFGGKLTALRYPELELVSVNAFKQYYEPARPLV